MNLWHDIIDSLTDAIIVLSPAMEPQVVNPAAETMLGVSQVNAATVADLVRQNDWLGRMAGACLESGQDLGDMETVLATGPRELAVRVEVSPLLNAEGRPGGVIILLHDLSHEKGAAEAADYRRPEPAFVACRPRARGQESPYRHQGRRRADVRDVPDEQSRAAVLQRDLDGVNRIASLVEQVLMVSGPQRLARSRSTSTWCCTRRCGWRGSFPSRPTAFTSLQDFDPSLPDVVGRRARARTDVPEPGQERAEAMGERARSACIRGSSANSG